MNRLAPIAVPAGDQGAEPGQNAVKELENTPVSKDVPGRSLY
jgi:hypothetical protein